MHFLRTVIRIIFSLCAALVLAGCLPSSEANLDEQKDPHYLDGRAKVTSLDYKGAIEEFERALEANPRNSSAHLELALLYEEQMKDFAAAIFHYEQHLKLRPSSEYADRARERIKSCKMDLVKSEVLGPVNQSMQQELERLTTENMLLKQRVETLEAQLAGRPAQPLAPTPPRNSNPIQPPQPRTPILPQPTPLTERATAGNSPAKTGKEPAPKAETRAARTYTVKSGDKLTTIAKEHGVDLAKLMQANPGVDPTRLKIGQTINIP